MNISVIKKVASILGLLAVIGGLCYCGMTVINALMEKGSAPSPRTIEEITSLNFDDIDHIKTTKTDMAPTEFSRLFRNNQYEPYSGDADYKRSETYRCYDSNDSLIMTLKEYPQDSIIELNVSGEISLYQKTTTPTNK